LDLGGGSGRKSPPRPSTHDLFFFCREIYDEHLSNHRTSEGEDKSLSMELPIGEEKIQDVLHSILKLRS
jgi:hypothetical protein